MTPEEKARHHGVPLIPANYIPPAMAPVSGGIVAICGKCGLEVRGVMSYSCSQDGCPAGFGSYSTCDVAHLKGTP